MKDIDRWAAEQCGVTEGEYLGINVWWQGERSEHSVFHKDRFCIKKADCREIVREHFRIDTNEGFGDDKWSATANSIIGKGKTISEAEIACITAIRESENA